jgi:hypothetical protein
MSSNGFKILIGESILILASHSLHQEPSLQASIKTDNSVTYGVVATPHHHQLPQRLEANDAGHLLPLG